MQEAKSKQYEAFVSYAACNNSVRINADNLLALEKGLLESLEMVQKSLQAQWSADDKRTVREVLEEK